MSSESDLPAPEQEFLILNAVVLKKMATTEAIAHATGLSLEQVEKGLAKLASTGAVIRANAHSLPTEIAQPRLREYVTQHYGDLGRDPAIARWLARFESINKHFLETVRDWQQVPMGDHWIPNDHQDPEYDDRVIMRFDALVTRLARLIDELGRRIPRLERYKGRFEEAMQHVSDGQIEYLSSAAVDSVQNIWFEFHADVLGLVGAEREE